MIHWLYLLLCAIALGLALTTSKPWLLGLSLLAAAAFFLAWGVAWYRARLGDNPNDASSMIDPVELRRLRELAEAKRRQAAENQQQSTPPQ